MIRVFILFIFSLNCLYSAPNEKADVDVGAMTIYEKLDLYSKLKSTASSSVWLAGTIGLGSGSFVQGDAPSGIVGLGTEILGLGLFGGSFAAGRVIAFDNPSGILIVSGALIFICSRIFQIVRPFYKAKEMNDILLRASNKMTLAKFSNSDKPISWRGLWQNRLWMMDFGKSLDLCFRQQNAVESDTRAENPWMIDNV